MVHCGPVTKAHRRLNELLDGRVKHWVDENAYNPRSDTISWRFSELNVLLSVPERLAYEAYHAALDLRLWWRWQQLQKSYGHDPAAIS